MNKISYLLDIPQIAPSKSGFESPLADVNAILIEFFRNAQF